MDDQKLKERKKRAVELILEDEVFMGRVNRQAAVPAETLRKAESLVEKAVEDFTRQIDDDDDAYIRAAAEVKKVKTQILNELKGAKPS